MIVSKPNPSTRIEPEYLQRRAPARVEITDDSGRPLNMTSGYVHVNTGSKIRLRVIPSSASGGEAPYVDFGCTDAIVKLQKERIVRQGIETSTVGVLQARQRGRPILPKRAELHITVASPGDEPLVQIIPVAIWPNFWSLLLVCLTLVAGSSLVMDWFFNLFLTWLLNFLGDIARSVVGETPRGLLALIFVLGAGFAISALLLLIGWLFIWLGWIGGDSV
jgi:hypothetical protein